MVQLVSSVNEVGHFCVKQHKCEGEVVWGVEVEILSFVEVLKARD